MEEPTPNVKRRRVESEESRSLYLCTVQVADCGPHYNVYAINFADLLSCSCKIHVQPPTVDGGDELVTTKVCDHCSSGAGQLPLLRKLASILGRNLCYLPGCGVFGSQIIFAGGFEPDEGGRQGPSRTTSKKIYVFETDYSVDSNPSIKPLSESSRRIIPEEFIGNKPEPFMVEFNRDDGKKDLYAISGSPFPMCGRPSFEVLYGTSKKWVALPDVPFFQFECHYFSYAVVGTKILVSSFETPVFCFDVAEEPERQHWRELSFRGMDFFPFAGTALVLDLDDSDDEKLMFACQTSDEEYPLWNLAAYRVCMTEKNESVELLGSNLIPPDQFPLQFGNVFCQYRLLDLGGGNVCLVVGSDGPPEDDTGNRAQLTEMRFLVIRFHFSFSRRKTSISVDILASHIFEYDVSCYTSIAQMVGCFLIAKPTLESECHPWTREW